MDYPYRAYYDTDLARNATVFFRKDGAGYTCTHGNWYGEPIKHSTGQGLKHAYGVAKFTGFVDLTKEGYNELWEYIRENPES